VRSGTESLPLLVFADDWGRHPSSCQHLIRHLLPRHPIYWVNTIGMRTPRLNLATLARGLEKARHWLRPARRPDALPDNLRVLSPRMWPWFGSSFSRYLNRNLLRRQLAPLLGELSQPAVAVTTIPVVADLMGVLPVRRWVYYCVDDFGVWPGLDQATLRRMEEEVIGKADALIAVSETLQAKLRQSGKEVRLLTHGIEEGFWAAGPDGPLPEVAGLERPLVVFWGALDRRMDVGFVRALAAGLEAGTVVLVGPRDDPDPALFEPGRVVHFPPLPYAHLPRLAREAGVLVMPYADLPVTRAIQPLKLKEYLATGRPVVVRDLPATRPWADCLDLADTPESFVAAVRRRLAEGLPEGQRLARGRLAGEGWAAKAEAFRNWLLEEEASPHVACSR
jgi:glycosyltransferase involved in cell wall biosynthesis